MRGRGKFAFITGGSGGKLRMRCKGNSNSSVAALVSLRFASKRNASRVVLSVLVLL